jgi:hypothetical protein
VSVARRAWLAKRLGGLNQPGRRGWVKVKNRDYWRHPFEVESVRSRERSDA